MAGPWRLLPPLRTLDDRLRGRSGRRGSSLQRDGLVVAAATSVGQELEAPTHASPRRVARRRAVTVFSKSSPGARRRVASPRRSRASLSSAARSSVSTSSRRTRGPDAASKRRRLCVRQPPRISRWRPRLASNRTRPWSLQSGTAAQLSVAAAEGRPLVFEVAASRTSAGGFAPPNVRLVVVAAALSMAFAAER